MKLLLRLENVAIFSAIVLAYAMIDGRWWLFATLILVPDLSMLGYLGGSRIGAICYNVVHSWIAPAVLFFCAWVSGLPVLLECSLILAAHISMDRIFGYGLKHATGFKDTHLGRIGSTEKPVCRLIRHAMWCMCATLAAMEVHGRH